MPEYLIPHREDRPRLHNVDSPLDPGMLSKTLNKISINDPTTFGGKFKDPSKNTKQHERFTTHTPPDITNKTRIIAVCGLKKVEPHVDGWFLSDFFAFWHLFQGLTESQYWLYTADLDTAVKTHKEYLHGNPFKDRKVVLDADILDRARNGPQPITHARSVLLREKFRSKIRSECRAAEKDKGNVLILIFAHGFLHDYGVEIGTGRKLTVHHFRNIVKEFNVPITLLSTACYSGGWACSPELNISAITAAGPDLPSRSWTKSHSLGRYAGSMFATAIIEKLKTIGNTNKILGETDEDDDDDGEQKSPTDQQYENMAEFDGSCYESLLRDTDRRGYEHEMAFSAEDDAWEMCWSQRTGIPLADYEKRWNDLRTYPFDPRWLHPGDPFNRDPHITADQEAEFIELRDERNEELKRKGKNATTSTVFERVGNTPQKRKTSGMYGGTVQGLTSMVISLGADYLNSYKGNDDAGNDLALHGAIHNIQAGLVGNVKIIEQTLRALEYRMSTMSMADKYLEDMVVPAPSNQSCFEFDVRNVSKKVGQDKYLSIIQMICDRKVLFPEPLEHQGRVFYKGHIYLVVAFHEANTSKAEVEEKLDALAEKVDEELELQKDIVKRDPDVSAKRQKLFGSFGFHGNISPVKRRSRGMSLTGAA